VNTSVTEVTVESVGVPKTSLTAVRVVALSSGVLTVPAPVKKGALTPDPLSTLAIDSRFVTVSVTSAVRVTPEIVVFGWPGAIATSNIKVFVPGVG
jgi:hypothetical protein